MSSPTTTTVAPCPPPVVYVVPAQPAGWMALSALLAVLWVGSLLARRRVPRTEVAPGLELHGARPVQEGDYASFAAALRSMGLKQAEIKERWLLADKKAPLEEQVKQAVRSRS